MEDIYSFITNNGENLAIALSLVAIISGAAMWLLDGRYMRVKGEVKPAPPYDEDRREGTSAFKPSAIANHLEPPVVSIIVTCHNQAEEVKSMVQEIFKQDFSRYEIVVVDMASTDNTADVIRVLSEDHKNVRHTFVPASTICVNHDYLALVLGLRLSRTPWVLFLPVGATFSRPDSLRQISSYLDDEHDFALIFANSRSSYNGRQERRIAWRSFLLQMRTWHTANSNPLPWSGSSIVAMRKSVFIKSGGLETPNAKGMRPLDAIIAELSMPYRNLVIKNPATVVNISPDQCPSLTTRRMLGSKSAKKLMAHLVLSRIAFFIGILCSLVLAAGLTFNLSYGIVPSVPEIILISLGIISIISVIITIAVVKQRTFRVFTSC